MIQFLSKKLNSKRYDMCLFRFKKIIENKEHKIISEDVILPYEMYDEKSKSGIFYSIVPRYI